MTDVARLIQLLMDFAPRGEPMDAMFLSQYGMRPDDVRRLAGDGWLRQLSENAFLLRGDSPTVDGALAYWAKQIRGLHVSGRAALYLHGVRHYVCFRERTDLWADIPFSFPDWTEKLLLLTYEHEPLFDCRLAPGFAISALPWRNARVPVSSPERAVLEYLATHAKSEHLREDIANLIGMLRTVRLDVLQTLANHCLRRDVVWLLKFAGEEDGVGWARQLDC